MSRGAHKATLTAGDPAPAPLLSFSPRPSLPTSLHDIVSGICPCTCLRPLYFTVCCSVNICVLNRSFSLSHSSQFYLEPFLGQAKYEMLGYNLIP